MSHQRSSGTDGFFHPDSTETAFPAVCGMSLFSVKSSFNSDLKPLSFGRESGAVPGEVPGQETEATVGRMLAPISHPKPRTGRPLRSGRRR
jgi:hypothetical protein